MRIKEKITAKKQGGASIFIVVFTIIVLSIIVLGFTRLIISETTKTTNTDLSQSAYDSALAGVEDAKVALLKYHKCLDEGWGPNSSGNECQQIIYYMQEGIRNNDCSTVQKVLGRYRENEDHSVVIQETKDSSTKGNNKAMLQAYTCVTIQEDLNDYRTTLSDMNRLRIIPLRTSDDQQIDQLELGWFSPVNLLAVRDKSSHYCVDYLYAFDQCGGGGYEQAPTTLMVKLIQTDEEFNLAELSTAKDADKTDTGSLMFVPTYGGGKNKIDKTEWGKSANKGENNPIKINCEPNRDWFCTATISLPDTFNGNTKKHAANSFLIVSIPYGSPETDISLKTVTNEGISKFTGVQARIDSTGRANDLYRRVETRLELVDTYYPYPEFEININSSNPPALKKTFYATLNCWGSDNGYTFRCENSHEDESFSNLP